MDPTIAQAKADANAIVTGVQALVPDTRFAVAQFRDAGDSPEYALTQPFTSNATDVQNAINSYAAGGGGDNPEAYNVVFGNAPGSGYRPDARKFLIVLGDAQPHGNVASQGFAGCIDESGDPHGLVTSNVLAALNAAQITLMMIRQVDPLKTTASLQCYQSLAAAGFAGGQAVDGGTDL